MLQVVFDFIKVEIMIFIDYETDKISKTFDMFFILEMDVVNILVSICLIHKPVYIKVTFVVVVDVCVATIL